MSPTWSVLLTAMTVSDELLAGMQGNPDVFRFKMLPFVALRPGHPWVTNPPPGTRITAFTETSYALAWAINRLLLEADHVKRIRAPNGNRWAVGLNETPGYVAWMNGGLTQLPLVEHVRIGHPAVLSLSLQLRQGRRLADDDILSMTTRVASRVMPVIVAAGNWGILGEGSLSPLARLPWTIAVGAASDEAGTRRHPSSSIGRAGDDPDLGVTITAYGENPHVPGTYGTSYAVPRAVAQVLTLTSFLLQIRRVDETNRTGLLGGVPLLQRFTVDMGFRDFDPRPSLPLSMIPNVGINQSAVQTCLGILQAAGIALEVEPSPAVIRKMLIETARPVPGAESFEVGAGFVCKDTTMDYLRRFDGERLAELFVDGSLLDDALRSQLRRHLLADDSQLDILEELSRRSSLSLCIDFRTGEIHASMRDPSMKEGARGITKDASRYSWPPPTEG